MTSLERCLAAIAGKPVDRVPVFPLLMFLSADRAGTGDDVAERLGVDVKCAVPRPPSRPGLYRDEGRVGDYYRITDELGIGWRMPVAGGHYYDLYRHPLADAENARDVARQGGRPAS